MRNRTSIDRASLQTFQAPGVFTRIETSVKAGLSLMPEVLDRINGCASFCYTLGRDPLGEGKLSGAELVGRRTFLRAALAEYASMEDAAVVDFDALDRGERPAMRDSLDGRIHVVRLLRHANIHLASTRLSHTCRGAAWDGPLGRQDFQHLVILGDQLPEAIAATRDAKHHYDSSDLAAMTDWLVAEQQQWGLNHVILRSAEMYAHELFSAV